MTSHYLAIPLLATLLVSQFDQQNRSGVSAAYVGLFHSDSQSHNLFWTTLGGQRSSLGQPIVNPAGEETTLVISFPGVAIHALGSGPGGSSPSTSQIGASRGTSNRPSAPATLSSAALSYRAKNPNILYIGFRAKSLTPIVAGLKAIGVEPLPESSAQIAYFPSPNGIRVRVVEDRSLSTSIRSDEVSLKVSDVNQAARWYETVLGARVSSESGSVIAQVPGLNIRLRVSNDVVASGLSHTQQERLGFEASTGLSTRLQRLAFEGIKVIVPYYATSTQFNPYTAFGRLEGPAGTIIELDEGFQAAVKPR